jgi:hypothetical protein
MYIEIQYIGNADLLAYCILVISVISIRSLVK